MPTVSRSRAGQPTLYNPLGVEALEPRQSADGQPYAVFKWRCRRNQARHHLPLSRRRVGQSLQESQNNILDVEADARIRQDRLDFRYKALGVFSRRCTRI